jgi:hypothetical protein
VQKESSETFENFKAMCSITSPDQTLQARVCPGYAKNCRAASEAHVAGQANSCGCNTWLWTQGFW